MDPIRLTPEDYRPRPPPHEIAQRYGIALVGCGGIARGAHLPAYRDFGFRVVAACDVVEESARDAARDFAIPLWTTDLDRVLARDDVDIVDLAVHAQQRPALVERIAAAGKHILSQKPFAHDLVTAQQMVGTCCEAGVTLMVNQQARWAPAHRAIRVLIERGLLGHLYSALHVKAGFQDVPGSWFVSRRDFCLVDYGCHHTDLARYFTGRTPVRVKATATRVPGQHAVSPMIYSILCDYGPEAGLMTTLHFNDINPHRAFHQNEWVLDGTEGSLRGTQDRVRLARRDGPEAQQEIAIEGSWFPEAFGGSMGELMTALAEGREPATSGSDNLASLGVALAAVASSESGEAVAFADTVGSPERQA